MSRAISDNLQCGLTREHPISKQWAQKLPPLQDNFAVTREVLFKFLLEPLKPEPQDLHDRTHKKLQESKSIQQEYDDSLLITPEQKYYCGIRLLEQFNDKFLRQFNNPIEDSINNISVNISDAKVLYNTKRKEFLFEHLKNALDGLYKNSKDNVLKRKFYLI